MSNYREALKDKKRIVIKVGSSSITHSQTGNINLMKLEKLVRVLCDLKNQGKDVILVSSGAVSVGRQVINMKKPENLAEKQACAAIGQCRLMMTYQKLFAEYNQIAAQVLLTKDIMINEISRQNAANTFNALLEMNAIPIVNENDTVSTYELEKLINFGDNDRLSAMVAAITSADLLILLSDIDGLFTDDPNKNADAEFISVVETIDEKLEHMAKGASSDVGTGGMAAKIMAAKIATLSGADMVIANSNDLAAIADIIEGKAVGTLFVAHKNPDFNIGDMIEQ